MVQFTVANDSATTCFHAFLGLPKYGFWLPIELSLLGPPSSRITSLRHTPRRPSERHPHGRGSCLINRSPLKMPNDLEQDQRRTSVCGAWPNVLLNARLK